MISSSTSIARSNQLALLAALFFPVVDENGAYHPESQSGGDDNRHDSKSSPVLKECAGGDEKSGQYEPDKDPVGDLLHSAEKHRKLRSVDAEGEVVARHSLG